MARPSESKSRPSSPSRPDPVKQLAKPITPIKPVGIIILPPPPQDDDDSPPSSTHDPQQINSTTSLPDLPGADNGDQRTLNRRATTSTTALNVKFAPLPQLAPRKRRSSAPMGIASRAAIMRRRRAGMPGFDMNGDPLPPTPPMWTEEEVERHTQRILAERSGQTPPAREHSEDPIVKMFKGAGKLWRKVNNNKKHNDGAEKCVGGDEVKGGVVVAERLVLAPLPSDNMPSGEEGGVWEEEVGDHFPLNVGQTETIVEGQFSWSTTTHLKPPLDENESVSDDASAREHNLSSTEGTEEDSTLESHAEKESTLGSHS
ncbi:hypothetical protein MVEN_02012100 [Mycena venus]|uniref:Uncharacterized protein n=1 Tax=Mycena venus TaxID=2733690 RepID=A0A8H6XAV9_9AGAR|nr:hypothetical protein MVEN_02012100 [Mycena venus]